MSRFPDDLVGAVLRVRDSGAVNMHDRPGVSRELGLRERWLLRVFVKSEDDYHQLIEAMVEKMVGRFVADRDVVSLRKAYPYVDP